MVEEINPESALRTSITNLSMWQFKQLVGYIVIYETYFSIFGYFVKEPTDLNTLDISNTLWLTKLWMPLVFLLDKQCDPFKYSACVHLQILLRHRYSLSHCSLAVHFELKLFSIKQIMDKHNKHFERNLFVYKLDHVTYNKVFSNNL